ncbi:hypothetical protein PROFUN_13433 [Planoprotostelium fungivorum]|uniref:F-box domain-containing protein n=1 Tax=Planoprotostelium fungivorum TaxID=1890364 RepID=A0A2P6N412_9EUKA|nr:hypothetical protein PROFUN_13433 [Planoprotostelium fungivorum]
MSISTLPHDALSHVFTFLDLKDIPAINLVSRKWSECAKREVLWKKYCKWRGYLADIIPEQNQYSWRDLYMTTVRHYPHLVDHWRWNVEDRDSSIEISSEGEIAKRGNGGHNPSIRGNTAMSGMKRHYYEVKIDRIGAWFSFGFASKEFDASAREHIGKGRGSCAYYSDVSTHRIFCPGYDDVNVPALKDGDVVGILLDMKVGSASFYVNEKFVCTVNNPIWSNDVEVYSAARSDMNTARSSKWLPKYLLTGDTQIQLFPALSVGSFGSARVVKELIVPQEPPVAAPTTTKQLKAFSECISLFCDWDLKETETALKSLVCRDVRRFSVSHEQL